MNKEGITGKSGPDDSNLKAKSGPQGYRGIQGAPERLGYFGNGVCGTQGVQVHCDKAGYSGVQGRQGKRCNIGNDKMKKQKSREVLLAVSAIIKLIFVAMIFYLYMKLN